MEGKVVKGKDYIRMPEAWAFFNPSEVRIKSASNLDLNLQSILTLVLKSLMFFAIDNFDPLR